MAQHIFQPFCHLQVPAVISAFPTQGKNKADIPFLSLCEDTAGPLGEAWPPWGEQCLDWILGKKFFPGRVVGHWNSCPGQRGSCAGGLLQFLLLVFAAGWWFECVGIGGCGEHWSSSCGLGWEGWDISFSFLVFCLEQVQLNIAVSAKGDSNSLSIYIKITSLSNCNECCRGDKKGFKTFLWFHYTTCTK